MKSARINRRLALVIGAGAIIDASLAHAQFGGRRERQWIIETQRPVRGYSGFVGPRNYYCDYVRYPNRQCSIDRAGRERCRIVGWRMAQRCA